MESLLLDWSPPPEEALSKLKLLEHREWWLWWTAFAIMVLMLVAIASMALPHALEGGLKVPQALLIQNVRLLACAVFLFVLYAVYQRTVIKRMRGEMIEQAETNMSLQIRAEELRNLAVVDPLTGVYNRRLMDDRVGAEISRANRYHYPLAVMAFDMNGFKQINDTWGHAAGDAILKHFCARLKQAIRGSDTPGRMGGDEFVVVLPECELSETELILKRLGNLEAQHEGKPIPFRFAAGSAQYRPGEQAQELLERVDQELYKNKRAQKIPVPSPTSS